MEVEMSMADSSSLKVLMFLIVQALVYLILSKSSNVFSDDKMMMTSLSFKPPRSLSIRRLLASISDLPQGVEPSPSSSSSPSSRGLESPILQQHAQHYQT